MKTVSLTQAQIRQMFDYDPISGLMTRKISTGSRGRDGAKVGTLVGAGYLKVSINYENFLVHRLVWLHVHGVWPTEDIDHINGVKTDNRLANLRLVTKSQNQHNIRQRHNNTSGFTGVRPNTTENKWAARITVNSKEIHLGCFSTKEAAAAAYQNAKRIYHPTAPQRPL